MGSGGVRIEIEKFDGSRFDLWKMKMEDMLVDRDLWSAIEDDPPVTAVGGKDAGASKATSVEPLAAAAATAAAASAAWTKTDRKAKGLIRLFLADSILTNVMEETSARSLWRKLESLYQSKSLVNKLLLRKKWYKLRMHEGDSFSEHLTQFNTVVSQLISIGEKISDEDRAITLLCSLPDSWDNLIVVIGGSGDKELSYDTVCAALLSEETRRGGSEAASKGALSVSRSRPQRRESKHVGFRDKSRGRSKSQEREKEKKPIRCWRCNESGHVKSQCPNRAIQKKETPTTSGTKKESDSGDMYIAAACVAQRDSDVWYVDTGASYHMTPHRHWFCEYERFEGGDVMLGDDSAVQIVGRGKVMLKLSSGITRTLPNVMHIPGMSRNLISVGSMADAGVLFSCDKYSCKMTRGAMVIATGVRHGTLYTLLGETVVPSGALISESQEDDQEELSRLWHHRLGHISEKAMSVVASGQMVEGVPKCSTSFGFCEHCLLGKQTRVSFRGTGTRATGLLELIHSDVFGPTPAPSLGGARYYVSFTDDFSRYSWVYFLRSKAEVLDRFKEFKNLVENQLERKVKVLRSDNGGEYCSDAFERYCTEQGIARQKTTPYTPEQNGVSERLNRTLMEKARCMLSWASLGKEFWAEAVATANYLKNRSPTSSVEGCTPFEAIFKRKPNLAYARVFGCEAYVHIPKEKRGKLDAKSEKCIFVGYKEGIKGYKLWNPVTRTVVFSRDVVFHETSPQVGTQAEKAKVAEEEIVVVEGSSEQEATATDADSDSESEELEVERSVDESEGEADEIPLLRRSTRERRAPIRYPQCAVAAHCCLNMLGEDPISAKDARSRADSDQWELAMVDEMDSLQKNQTWSLCRLPKGRKAIGSKWVFKQKVKADGTVEKFKARLVAKGFSQVEGVDYDEIFSPVAKMTSIRVVLSIAAAHDLEIEQMDVKTAFLHGDLEEEIYMRQPEGFEAKGKEDLVCRLKKSLYGLKQAPRMWYQKFDTYMLELGFERSNSDHCVYIQRKGEQFIILTLYVDDMLLVGNSVRMIQHLKRLLSAKFEMKDLGPASVILGMQISRDRSKKKLWLGQQRYVEEMLKKFNMTDCKPVGAPMPVGYKLSAEMSPKTHEEAEDMAKVPYASAVGSLMYAMVCTRPDIAQAVGVLSRYMATPGKEHWNAVKRVFRYLRGTSSYTLCFEGAGEGGVLDVVGHVDSDWGGDLDSRRSTSAYVFTMFGGAVSWMSRRQNVVALSSTEAEYMALTHASKEAIWLRRLCLELGFKQGPVEVRCDNQGAIHLAKNPAFHSRTKHIDIQYHFIREKVEKKVVQLEKVDTKENSSDFLTKAVPVAKFEWCAAAVGLQRKSGEAALIGGRCSPSGRMLELENISVQGSSNGVRRTEMGSSNELRRTTK